MEGGESIPVSVSEKVIPDSKEVMVEVPSKDTFKEGEKLNIEEVKRKLLDPREISKEKDARSREETTEKVGTVRTEQQTISKEIVSSEAGLASKSEKIGDLASALSKRTESFFVKVKSALSVNDSRSVELHEEIQALRGERVLLEEKLTDLKETKTNMPKGKELLDAYYEKVSTLPLTNEEKRKYLKPEFLESLTTEEYIALWKRLNPNFLSHATRQGFRDHTWQYHNRGAHEYHNGFVEILSDDKQLRTPFAVEGLRSRSEEVVKDFIEKAGVLKAENGEESKEMLHNLLEFSHGAAPQYPDKTAVHFATEYVMSDLYGGETNNEVFFVYPADVLISQNVFAFNQNEGNFIRPFARGEYQWNDVMVWPESLDNPGFSLNSGIVFLPETTLVDSVTGSKYESEIILIAGEEKRVLIQDEELVSKFTEYYQNIRDNREVVDAFNRWMSEAHPLTAGYLHGDLVSVVSKQLMELGINRQSSIDIADEFSTSLFALLRGTNVPTLEDCVELMKKANGANWRRAVNTISAKEYWESFFNKHPNLKPQHVVYYDGDQTRAVEKFLRENGIGIGESSESDREFLGFKDHNVELVHRTFDMDLNQDPRVMRGYDELIKTGYGIIEEHYQSSNGE